MRGVPRQRLIAPHSMGASLQDIYRHLVIPTSLQRIFTALRIGIGASLAVLFFTEDYATATGISLLIINS